MDKNEGRLLEAFSRALQKKKENVSFDNSEESLRFFRLAKSHKILPLVIESLEDPSIHPYYLKEAVKEARTQARRTGDFLLLYDYLLKKGFRPLVLKGIICRNLYPNPEERPSSDEDLFIERKDFPKIHEALLSYGLKLVDPEEDIEESYEVAYEDKESLLYIEVHKDLFPPDSVYGYFNDYFKDNRERFIREKIYQTEFYTLSHTDHLQYLIFHAYKHFLHSGFGIRQVGDILLFSITYQDSINWKKIREALIDAKAFDLTRAIYKISRKYLIDDRRLFETLKDWDIDSIEEEDLLEDILKSGIYGASSFTRLHTSTMTLNALEKKSVFSSVFPPLGAMSKKYPYLKKRPYLLPLSWGQRVFTYLKETRKISDNDPQESLELGKKRIGLLKKYHVIQK